MNQTLGTRVIDVLKGRTGGSVERIILHTVALAPVMVAFVIPIVVYWVVGCFLCMTWFSAWFITAAIVPVASALYIGPAYIKLRLALHNRGILGCPFHP